MSSGRSELYSDVEHELSQLNQQALHLNELPLLGLSTQKNDDSTDFGALLGLDSEVNSTAAEDQGIALKREFMSLLQRYLAELQRTRALIEQRQQLAGSTQASSAPCSRGTGRYRATGTRSIRPNSKSACSCCKV